MNPALYLTFRYCEIFPWTCQLLTAKHLFLSHMLQRVQSIGSKSYLKQPPSHALSPTTRPSCLWLQILRPQGTDALCSASMELQILSQAMRQTRILSRYTKCLIEEIQINPTTTSVSPKAIEHWLLVSNIAETAGIGNYVQGSLSNSSSGNFYTSIKNSIIKALDGGLGTSFVHHVLGGTDS